MNLIVSWLVSSGAKCSTPPDGTTTSRGPAGLVISTWVAWAAMPVVAAVSSISLISFFPLHFRVRLAFGPDATQPVAELPSSRFCGRNTGSEPNVELAVMVSCGLPGLSEASSELSWAPGTAVAVPATWKRCRCAVVKVRFRAGSGGWPGRPIEELVARSKLNDGVGPDAVWDGCRKRVTHTPGIATPLMPAPGPPAVPPLVASMVIRRKPVVPDGMFSFWVAPVTEVAVSTLPVAVVTVSRVATGRGMSSSSLTSTGVPRSIGWLKLICSHCPAALVVPSTQAVPGLPSHALTGSPCGYSQIHEPAEDAVTLLAPRRTATVWWPPAPAGSSWRGAWPAAPSGSSGGFFSVAVYV